MKNLYFILVLLLSSCVLHAKETKMSVYFTNTHNDDSIHALPLKKNIAAFKIVFFFNDREMEKDEVLLMKYYKTGDGSKWLLKDKKAFKINKPTMIGKLPHQYNEPGVYKITFENEKGEILGEDSIVIYSQDGFQKQLAKEDLECYFSYSISPSDRADSENISFASNAIKEGRVFLKRPKDKFDGIFRWRIYYRNDTQWIQIDSRKGERKMINPLSIPINFKNGSGDYLVEIYNSELQFFSFIYLNVL